MVDITTIAQALSAASTIAIILGIPFILLQMRQNARMIEAANRQAELVAAQNRSQVMLNIAEHMTNPDFIRQRKVVRDIIARRVREGWDGFFESADGFELRAFAVQYESAALMARLGLISREMLIEALGFTIAVDWIALGPALKEFERAWGQFTFPNFQALAAEAERYWHAKGAKSPEFSSLVPGAVPAAKGS